MRATAEVLVEKFNQLNIEEAVTQVRASFQGIRDKDSVWLNDEYQVNIREAEVATDWPAMLHLSIKRIDKDVIHDWRDLQEIKNLLVAYYGFDPASGTIGAFQVDHRRIESPSSSEFTATVGHALHHVRRPGAISEQPKVHDLAASVASAASLAIVLCERIGRLRFCPYLCPYLPF